MNNEKSTHKQNPLDISSVDKRVLLVDDMRLNLMVTEQMLRVMGCAVDIAYDGLEAVEMTEKNQYQLVMMDCQMPNMDGLEATRLIRKMEAEQQRKTLPVIALTGNVSELDIKNCLAAGMNDVLTKPVIMLELQSMLARWL